VIVVAGLTPAWQKTLSFDRLTWGEVNRAAEASWCASGKVLNVGIAASRLGATCRTICPVGGPAREPFRRELGLLGVDVDWVPVSVATRVCTTLLDRATGTMTELVENAPPLSAAELRSYVEMYAATSATARTAVFSGSLPADVPKSFYRELAEVTPGRIIADVRGPELTALLDGPKKLLLAKPNREELAATVGRPLDDDADLHAAMRELNERGAEWVVVTAGPQAVWISSGGRLWRAVPPRVERVVNPIGCGDCLAAGIAVGLDAGRDVLESLRLGMAAAVDNLGTLLPARIDKSHVERIAATIEIVALGD
jgi:1-phosphofructokinase family hexose kinase